MLNTIIAAEPSLNEISHWVKVLDYCIRIIEGSSCVHCDFHFGLAKPLQKRRSAWPNVHIQSVGPITNAKVMRFVAFGMRMHDGPIEVQNHQ
jgi:hypothetical protein